MLKFKLGDWVFADDEDVVDMLGQIVAIDSSDTDFTYLVRLGTIDSEKCQTHEKLEDFKRLFGEVISQGEMFLKEDITELENTRWFWEGDLSKAAIPDTKLARKLYKNILNEYEENGNKYIIVEGLK